MTSEAQSSEVAPLASTARRAPALILASMRPKQWLKNLALLVPIVFAREALNPERLFKALAAVALFCALSGAVYLMNDARDAERDRLHPRKRLRPMAAGELRVETGVWAAALIGGAALALAVVLSPAFGLVAAAYLALQGLYVLALKEIVILDVLALALGFVLRAVAGAVVVGVPISPWLYFCALLLALFLALGKRRQELVSLTASDAAAAGGTTDVAEGEVGLARRHRPALEEYTVGLLDQLIQVVTTCLVLAYSLYTFSAENLPRNHAMMLTVPFVLYGLFRYLYLVHVRGAGGAPEEILLRDRGIAMCVVLWALTAGAIIYLMPPGTAVGLSPGGP
jgi:4-hydroxybenzoate polyprenyltransferase